MDWFTKVFVSLKVGTDWFTGLLAPPVILNGTPPAWRGLYSERSKMHSGKGRHEVESAHKGKIVEDVVPELAPVPRRTIKSLWVCVGDWENVLLYSKLDHFEYSRRTTSPVDEHLMTPYMQANSTYKEERQKILQSREKKGKKTNRRQNWQQKAEQFFSPTHNLIEMTI